MDEEIEITVKLTRAEALELYKACKQFSYWTPHVFMNIWGSNLEKGQSAFSKLKEKLKNVRF